MPRKKRKYNHKGIPVLVVIGIVVIGIFWWLYGGMMLLRYLLGSLMFATVTVLMIKLLNKYFGKKRIKI